MAKWLCCEGHPLPKINLTFVAVLYKGFFVCQSPPRILLVVCVSDNHIDECLLAFFRWLLFTYPIIIYSSMIEKEGSIFPPVWRRTHSQPGIVWGKIRAKETREKLGGVGGLVGMKRVQKNVKRGLLKKSTSLTVNTHQNLCCVFTGGNKA